MLQVSKLTDNMTLLAVFTIQGDSCLYSIFIWIVFYSVLLFWRLIVTSVI